MMTFEEAWEECQPLSDMNERDARVLFEYARAVKDGEMWECGVSRGGSALLMRRANPTPYIRAFDTFEGFPPRSGKDTGFREDCPLPPTSARDVQQLLGHEAHVYKGTIPAVFRGLWFSRIGLLHVDLDLYEGTMEALRFGWPRMVSGGVVLVHDYGNEDWGGVNSAVEEFSLEKGVPFQTYLDGWHAIMRKP